MSAGNRGDSAARPWAWECAARVRADPATVFNLLAEAELWPAVFRHIHSARVLRRDGARRLLAVRATWRGIPIGWRAIQTVDANQGSMTLRQVSLLTRGSTAFWTVTTVTPGTTLTPRPPLPCAGEGEPARASRMSTGGSVPGDSTGHRHVEGAVVDVRVRVQPVLHLPGPIGTVAERLVGRRVARDLAREMLDRLKEVAEGGSLAGPR